MKGQGPSFPAAGSMPFVYQRTWLLAFHNNLDKSVWRDCNIRFRLTGKSPNTPRFANLYKLTYNALYGFVIWILAHFF